MQLAIFVLAILVLVLFSAALGAALSIFGIAASFVQCVGLAIAFIFVVTIIKGL